MTAASLAFGNSLTKWSSQRHTYPPFPLHPPSHSSSAFLCLNAFLICADYVYDTLNAFKTLTWKSNVKLEPNFICKLCKYIQNLHTHNKHTYTHKNVYVCAVSCVCGKNRSFAFLFFLFGLQVACKFFFQVAILSNPSLLPLSFFL